jgi:hypothetical protein
VQSQNKNGQDIKEWQKDLLPAVGKESMEIISKAMFS